MSVPRSSMILGAGPFKARDLPPGSDYELSNGHPILCPPTAGRGGAAQALNAQVLRTDPVVAHAGVDVGFQLGEGTLRAPNLAVIASAPGPGWVTEAPPLSIEYADTGQDEPGLQVKIAQLLAAGTRAIWVVRLGRIRQVEVYRLAGDGERGPIVRTVAQAKEELSLPGVLKNPVPVAALFDPDAAHAAPLHNLLDRGGYAHPEQAREEGRQEGQQEGRLAALRFADTVMLRGRGHADPAAGVADLDADALTRLIEG